MSYSLVSECETCTKSKVCIDRIFLLGAIHGIHSTYKRQGHRGSGNIKIECTNYVMADGFVVED
jgi:hypothetical protein